MNSTITKILNDKKNILIFLNIIAFTGFFASLLAIDGGLGGLIVKGLNIPGAGYVDYRVNGILNYGNTSAILFAFSAFCFIALSIGE